MDTGANLQVGGKTPGYQLGTSKAPRTRVGIQYVFREHVPDLAPLVPPKKGSR